MNISIVIPAYNEEKRIINSLKKVSHYCKNNFKKYEIIIVDDGSRDKTYQIISKLKIDNLKILKNKINKGKGYCVKRGILESRYSLVLFTDSDLSIPIEQLNKFIRYIKQGYQIVIASKYMKGSSSNAKQPIHRLIMGKMFSLLVRLLLLKDFKDTQCGFKLFETKVAKKIVRLQTCERYTFDVELLLIAKRMKIKIKELPIFWIKDERGTKINIIKDPIEMLPNILRIKINDLKGKYMSKTTPH